MTEPSWGDRPWDQEPEAVARRAQSERTDKRLSRGCLLAALAPVLLFGGCGIFLLTSGGEDSDDEDASAESEVSRADFGERGLDWPLIPDSGTLACAPVNHVIFTPDGETATYAVNGSAKGTGQWRDLDPIWAPDTEAGVSDLKISVGDLIDEGLALCE